MKKEEYLKSKAKFFKIFANIPFNLRDEIIAVVDDQSISWLVAYTEIKQDSEKASEILKQLKKLEVL